MSKAGFEAKITQRWWKEAVVYQIYPRSFQDSNGDGIGDLPGILSRLDYLALLGVDVLWLSPIFQSPNDDNGYDISDYQAILDDFGTMADFDALLQAAHQRGMRILLDLVINHTSDEHPWFVQAKASKAAATRDWYIWRASEQGPPNNWRSVFSSPAWSYNPPTDDYYLHVFSAHQPDLNWQNPQMRQALYQMVRWWLDKGVDGFRIDAITHIKKAPGLPNDPGAQLDRPSSDMFTNLPGIHQYIDELCQQAFAGYDIMTVGEANGVDVSDAPNWVNEQHQRFNMIFQFEQLRLWGQSSELALNIAQLKTVLNRWQTQLHGCGWNALFVENHDIPRVVSNWGNDDCYWRESSTAIATLYFLMQGTPFIYQGQELGMTNFPFAKLTQFDDVAVRNFAGLKQQQGWHEDEIVAAIKTSARDNARTPMQWSADHCAGFTTGKPWLAINENHQWLNAQAQVKDPQSIFQYYRQLIQLRKQHLGLVYGRFQLSQSDHPKMFCYERRWQGERFFVAVNLSDEVVKFELPAQWRTAKIILANGASVGDNNVTDDQFQPWQACVYWLSVAG